MSEEEQWSRAVEHQVLSPSNNAFFRAEAALNMAQAEKLASSRAALVKRLDEARAVYKDSAGNATPKHDSASSLSLASTPALGSHCIAGAWERPRRVHARALENPVNCGSVDQERTHEPLELLELEHVVLHDVGADHVKVVELLDRLAVVLDERIMKQDSARRRNHAWEHR